MTRSRRLSAVLVSTALIAGGAASFAATGALATRAHTNGTACKGAHMRPTSRNGALIRSATLCLINAARVAAGVPKLHANRTLGTVASQEVHAMIRYDYFADVLPSGVTPGQLIKATQYAARFKDVIAGEDIGWGTGYESTPAQMVTGWLDSQAHREVLLYPRYRDVGVGVIAAVPAFLHRREHGATYAVEFAARFS